MGPRCRPERNQCQGVTLIELLGTLVIGALLIGAILTALLGDTVFAAKEAPIITAERNLRAAVDLMLVELGHAAPDQLLLAERDSLTLRATNSADTLTYSFAVSTASEGRALWRQGAELIGPLEASSSFSYVLSDGSIVASVDPADLEDVRTVRIVARTAESWTLGGTARRFTLEARLRDRP